MVHSETDNVYKYHDVRIKVKKRDELIINKTHTIGGVLHKARITDLDRDNDPEIIIWVRSPGADKYGSITLFELEDGNLETEKLPSLPESLYSSYGYYAGHDTITISSSNVVRRFPTYRKHEAICCATGPTVEIVYRYKHGRIVVEHIRTLAGDKPASTQAVIAWKKELSCELLARGRHDGLCLDGGLYPARELYTGVADNGHLLHVAYTTPINASASLTIPIDGPRSLTCGNPDVSISSSDARVVFAVERDGDPRTRCTVHYTREGRVVAGTFLAVLKAQHKLHDPDAKKYKRTRGAFRVTLPRPDDFINATIEGMDHTNQRDYSGAHVLDVSFRPVDNRYPHFRRGRNATDVSADGRHWTINIPEIDFSGSGKVTCAGVEDYSHALIVFKTYAGDQADDAARPTARYSAGAKGRCTIQYTISLEGVVSGTFSGTLTPSESGSGRAPLTVTEGQFRFYLPDGFTS